MPPTTASANANLSILLEGGPRSFAAGDTIIGRVVRKRHAVSPSARVLIKLCGRAKVKIVVRRNNSTSTYRSRVPLIDEAQTAQALFEGPIHVPASGEEPLVCPFAVTIPALTPFDARAAPGTERGPLPSTMTMMGWSLETFVEYWLEANLIIGGQGDTHGSFAATQPIVLQTFHPGPPIGDAAVKLFRGMRVVSSQRLIPGMEDAELSTKDKWKKAFGTSSVPRFNFDLQVSAPTVCQLDGPAPLSILLCVRPKWPQTTPVIQNVPQKVRLHSVRLRLKAVSVGRAEGFWGDHEKDTDTELELVPDRYLSRLRAPILVPCSEDGPPINIGEALNLRLSFFNGRSIISPTYQSKIIDLKYFLEWNITVMIAGEDADARGQVPIVILPAPERKPGWTDQDYAAPPPPLEDARADSWIHPPADGDEPPSFTQVIEQDKTQNKAVPEASDSKQPIPEKPGEASGS
jgi:hypothetical protein